jgi:hypothetical protein
MAIKAGLKKLKSGPAQTTNDAAMVDRAARTELATSLRRLVDGELTNDAFDAAYYGRWEDSADKAVAETAAFGYSLYSSDLLVSYRLKGRHALPDEGRQTAQHALMFLETDGR